MRSAVLIVVVTFLTYFLVSLTPGDAAYTLLGARATPEQLQALRHDMELDQPLVEQYWRWLSSALHGDFGRSLLTQQSTSEVLSQRLEPTVSLLAGTVLVSVALGCLFGVLAAVRGGWLGRLVDLVGQMGLAVPNFVLGLILIAVFAVNMRLFPVSGYIAFAEDPGLWIRSLVLPVCGLAFGVIGVMARQLKVSMEEVMQREFITAMRANGYPQRSIIYRHALRNAGLPVVANLGVIVVGMLSGSVLMESVFALPGLGSLLVQASAQADLPLVEGVVVVMTVIIVAVNIGVDLISAWLDPRVVRP
ncbi:peptide/nickel transport system permease protein [Streptomyces zagrosensis]|uniref:Peptide/nickel transport system permease protein n=2 Tax=Streptomyces zagrosensis TaxID=1042984 RepID=A0A7W9QF65_9ACTN|nr:peptide/nickel transport system permease protein [Streptomyces zagrosensis]